MLHYPLSQINKPIPLSFPNVSRRLSQPPLKRCQTIAFGNSGGGKGMSWFHEIQLQVRPYELDQYGVVKDAVYNNYFEHGTQKVIDMFDSGAHDKILAASEISVKYIAPLRKNDNFVLKSRIYDYSACRLYFEYLIIKLPSQEHIVKGKSIVVLLDKNHKPCRVSPSTISKFSQFLMPENNKVEIKCSQKKGLESKSVMLLVETTCA